MFATDPSAHCDIACTRRAVHRCIGIRQTLTTLLPKAEIERLAHESGAMRRRRKVDASTMLWTVLLGRTNQFARMCCLRARVSDLAPVSRTPYGPAAEKGCIKRPDIRQYLPHMPPFVQRRACHQRGVHIRCERATLVFSLTRGRSSWAAVRGYAIVGAAAAPRLVVVHRPSSRPSSAAWRCLPPLAYHLPSAARSRPGRSRYTGREGLSTLTLS